MQESVPMRKLRKKIEFINSGEYPFTPERKEIRNEDGELHSETEFAVTTRTFCTQYKNGRRHGLHVTIFGSTIYYYEDRCVPPRYMVRPESLTVDEVLAEPNAEVRYAGISIMGYDKFLKDERVNIIDEEESEDIRLRRRLFHVKGILANEFCVVEVFNSTPEPHNPDGSDEPYYKRYFLPVPPECRTCQAAVAWTFGKEPSEYQPVHET